MNHPDIQKWLLNIAIFSLAVIIVGFMFSTGKRMVDNPSKITLNRVDTAPEVDKRYANVVIEVLNGCGEPGLAQQFTNYLRKEGFDVIYTGNANKMDYPETHLIKRRKEGDNSNVLMKSLSLQQENLLYDEDLSLHLDFTLVIGKDFKQLESYKQILEIKEQL